ncbi:hypothetical protein Lfu02_36350 [Longispora fulva]|uniref:Uncharacterized protein n=1 Tax=Longispora fulva TaxID=619741 RepID=A0A8J7GYF7_9ACTN|nr:hypothetical protein [Longispora fulva]MBG6141584.1 hypothetical protein [Longispora fulva]GIG59263.1 hypothetical protein Lfu02_36350 [Longispora fulva]
MPRIVLAFVPQHTTTKSRVMAIVDKGNGNEVDAVATVDWPHDAVAICNILNSPEAGQEAFSGLWAALPSSVRSSLERARGERVDRTDARHALASLFITTLDVPELPDPDADIDWAGLYPSAGCPDGGCDACEGCASHTAGQAGARGRSDCGPGGSCTCQTKDLADDEEPCVCCVDVIGPRWASAIYKSLAEEAGSIVDHAQDLMWGIEGPAVGFPGSLIAQPPQFFIRLAQACADLCDELAQGRVPVPHTIAELIMLDEAARFYLQACSGRDGFDVEEATAEMKDLPEAFGDFDMDALWMFQVTVSDWTEIADAETVYEPGSMDRVFDLLPEAAQWPRSSQFRPDSVPS